MKRKRSRVRKFDWSALSGDDLNAAEKRKKSLLGLMRLVDMDTEEVSVVDRAANQEDFLVVKRDEGGESMSQKNKKFKRHPLTAALKSAASARLSSLIATISEMLETVKAATGIEKSLEKPLPAYVGGGIGEVSSRLGAFIENPVAKNEDDSNKGGKTEGEGSGDDGGEGSEGGAGGEGTGAGEGSGADGGEGSGEDEAASETEKAMKQETSSIQSLIMSKERFKTAEAAQKWARDNGFKADKVDEPETGETFRLRQFEPSICKRIRTGEEITEGVKPVFCIREAEKAFEIPAPVQDAVTRTLSGVMEKASEVLASILEAPITEDEAVLGDERVSELKAVGKLLTGIGEKYPTSKPFHRPEDKKKPKKNEEKTEKRGAKISSDRVKKLVGLFEGLGSFLKDIGVQLGDKDVKKSLNALDALEPLRSASDPQHANGGSGLQPDLAVVSDFKTSLQDNPGLAATMKAAIAKIVDEETSQLKASLSKKDELIAEKDKAIEEKEGIIAKQAHRIKSFLDETPSPRGHGGGEGEPVHKRDGGEEDGAPVFWPLDMNAGGKEEVQKAGIWFGKD